MSNDTWRICTKCKEYKTWDLYYKSDNSGSGHMSRCKDCYTYYNKHRESQKHAKVDKSLLEIEKAYKSKENKIIGQMNRVLKKRYCSKKRDKIMEWSIPTETTWKMGMRNNKNLRKSSTYMKDNTKSECFWQRTITEYCYCEKCRKKYQDAFRDLWTSETLGL